MWGRTLILWMAVAGLVCDSAMLAVGQQRYFAAALVLGFTAVALFEFSMARKTSEAAAGAIADLMLGAAMLLAVVGGFA